MASVFGNVQKLKIDVIPNPCLKVLKNFKNAILNYSDPTEGSRNALARMFTGFCLFKNTLLVSDLNIH